MQENGDQLHGTIVKCIDAFLPPLELVWQRIEFAGDMLDAQCRSVVDRIRSLMSDLTAEADHRMQQLIESIHRN